MSAWLPLISALVIATVTTFGIVINNRANTRAITAADERNQTTLEAAQRNIELSNSAADTREHDKWRRDAVLESVSSILEVSEGILDALRRFEARQLGSTEEETDFTDLRTRLWSVSNSALKLQILSTHHLHRHTSQLQRGLAAAINDAESITRMSRTAYTDSGTAQLKLEDDIRKRGQDYSSARTKASQILYELMETTRKELRIPDHGVPPPHHYSS
ncbi:hypothetical protein [Nocardia suismassiliense]|uniref:hypothetical protein n=1 Tax=Nocardia suismassiliense TaxID=2077092 RepID=UPI00131ED728|nr:hypothetical protein [Nocardia suismassiliense]